MTGETQASFVSIMNAKKDDDDATSWDCSHKLAENKKGSVMTDFFLEAARRGQEEALLLWL